MGLELSTGAVVGARFRLDRLLGSGGMGTVWAATHQVTHKHVALKFLKSTFDTPDHRRRFLREARAATAVRHPNVREIYDVIELGDGTPVMVMEFLTGESLAQRLDGGALSVKETCALLLPVMAAVGSAHAHGIIHRDLKPENIFLARSDGDEIEVKVFDFGIAKLTAVEGAAAETAGLTQSGALLGTPGYMSPEQVFGEKDIDHGADVWALGLILYKCLSGTLPTEADNVGQVLKIILTRPIRPIAEVVPGLPADLADVVTRMLSRSRRARPSDLREVAAVLAVHAECPVPSFAGPQKVSSPDVVSADSAITDTSGVGLATTEIEQSRPSGPSATALTPGRGSEMSNSRPRPDRRVLAGAIAAVIAVAAGGWWMTRDGTAGTTAAVETSAPNVAPPESARPVVEPTPSAPSAVTEPPPLPATSSARPKASAVPRATAVAKPSAAPSAPPVAPPAPPPPTADPTTKGKVIEKPPF